MEAKDVSTFYGENDELWGVFVEGHVAPHEVQDLIAGRVDEAGQDGGAAIPLIEHRWMFRQANGTDDEYPWYLVARHAEPPLGALPVTGYFPE